MPSHLILRYFALVVTVQGIKSSCIVVAIGLEGIFFHCFLVALHGCFDPESLGSRLDESCNGWLVGLQSTEQKAFIRWLIKLTPRLIWKTSVLFMSSFSMIENSEQCKNIVIKIAICTHIFVCGGML